MRPPLRAEAQDWLAARSVSLAEGQWRLLDLYVRDVLEYGRKVNLTAARGEDELVRRHCLDALAALPALRERLGPGPRLADLGCGAGFVGICLKIAWPEASVTLIESVYRKFCFLNWTLSRLGVTGIVPVRARAGASPWSGDPFDAVLARALAPLPEAVGLAAPLAAPGGLVCAYQSQAPDPADPALARALAASGARLEGSAAYVLPGEQKPRHLALIRKEVDS